MPGKLFLSIFQKWSYQAHLIEFFSTSTFLEVRCCFSKFPLSPKMTLSNGPWNCILSFQRTFLKYFTLRFVLWSTFYEMSHLRKLIISTSTHDKYPKFSGNVRNWIVFFPLVFSCFYIYEFMTVMQFPSPHQKCSYKKINFCMLRGQTKKYKCR